jgi:peptidoglycan/LPS O-acetylase OafA/YrhL
VACPEIVSQRRTARRAGISIKDQSTNERTISGKWILLGGEISYSIYLLHFLIIDAFSYQAGAISSWSVAIGACLQLFVVLASIVGLSVVSYTFIESPCRILI